MRSQTIANRPRDTSIVGQHFYRLEAVPAGDGLIAYVYAAVYALGEHAGVPDRGDFRFPTRQ